MRHVLRTLRKSRGETWIFLVLFVAALFFVLEIHAQELESPWKFAVIADTQADRKDRDNRTCVNDRVLLAIAHDIVQEKPDFVLVAGDLVNGWFRSGGIEYAVQYANWRKAMEEVYRAGIRVYPIRGNHDSGPERVALPPLPSHLEPPPGTPSIMKKAFRSAFPESYIPRNGPPDDVGLTYSFLHKNVLVVGLDQYGDRQHTINQEWLDRQFEEKKARRHIFIFGHEPAFETRHKDNLSFYAKKRDAFWDSIGKAGGRVYFCGHDHFYNRAMIPDSEGNQIRQIIVGTGGGALREWSGAYGDNDAVKREYHSSDYHGYVIVVVEGSKATIYWKALIKKEGGASWSILDSFSYRFPIMRK